MTNRGCIGGGGGGGGGGLQLDTVTCSQVSVAYVPSCEWIKEETTTQTRDVQ